MMDDSTQKIGFGLVAAIVVFLAVMSATACASAGWKAVAMAQSAGKVADVQIAAAHKRQSATCIERHGVKTIGYRDCMNESDARKAMVAWRTYAVPAIDSGALAAVVALRSGKDWKKAFKIAPCALARIAGKWGHVLGPAKPFVMAAVRAADGVLCE